MQKKKEQERQKNQAMVKLLMKPKVEGEDDSDWESDIEEDFPHVQLTELLDNLKLDENPMENEEDDDEED